MNLYDNKEDLKTLIINTSEKIGLMEAIIEKDFYSMMFLKRLVEYDNNIIFKGGTSLSKCHKIISRYSEDIDLNYNGKVGDSKRKSLKKEIQKISEEMNMNISNLDETRSRRDFNRYLINYNQSFNTSILKESIVVEVALQIPSFPYVEKECSTYIYDYLKSINRNDIIERYELNPFIVKVQSLERTFIDKIFAICDYYLSGKVDRNSRHLYDLYKLSKVIDINSISSLIKEVRECRKPNPSCLSCKDGISIKEIVNKIIKERYYEDDYINITSKLVDQEDAQKYTYDTVIEILESMIENNQLDEFDKS